ncbi:MAG: adenine nucleotide alpha hydrolase [Planctomycetes bacterium]|nr:adenine nucleotide alpha hydrolase [Planctomycetota bacterium]
MTCNVALSWSSGKDSAWALHVLRGTPGLRVVTLLTTLNREFGRVAMHAVRRELLRAQARAAGLPLLEIDLPWPCSNADYERLMAGACDALKHQGITHVAFGDLFLQDIREYRERQLAPTGLKPLFPLWGSDTAALARQMIAGGLRATLTCVDPRQAPRELAGRAFDEALLRDLPISVDPCGERGEFHTFCHAGPMFTQPVPVQPGEVVERDGFVFADLRPGA